MARYDYDDARRYRRTSEDRYYGRDTDRDFGDRAADEVRSWFGDDDADRRRSRDEMRDDRSTRNRGEYDRSEYGRDEAFSDRSYRGDRAEYGADRDDRGRYASDYRTRGRRRDEDYDVEETRRTYGRGPESGGRARSYTRDYDRDANFHRDYYRDTHQDADGPYVGHGPKDYTRSTDRMVEDVNERLTDHGRIDATEIQVSAENGEVTLEGTVRSRREKRMAEDVAESVRGVRDIHNRLHIQQDDDFTDAADASNASDKKASRKA